MGMGMGMGVRNGSYDVEKRREERNEEQKSGIDASKKRLDASDQYSCCSEERRAQ